MTSYTIVERSETLPANPERIMPLLTDLRQWQEWSPWEGLDPALERTYSGPDSGIGATYQWSGNRKAGAGVMEITDVSDEGVDIALTFTRPFRSASLTDFRLRPDGDGTLVTWRMRTPRTLGMRIAGLFMNFDKALGSDFEKGLAALRDLVTER